MVIKVLKDSQEPFAIGQDKPSEVMKTQIQKRSLNSLSILILKEDNQWMLN